MAVSMMNNLFPPIVETYQPAFIYNTPAKISFSISPYNSTNNIRYLHVSLVDQRNNENALLGMLENNKYYEETYGQSHGYAIINGVLVIPFPSSPRDIVASDLIQYDRKRDLYTVDIYPAFLRKKDQVPILSEDTQDIEKAQRTKYFNVGQFYKVQLRLDSSPIDLYQWGLTIQRGLQGGFPQANSNLAESIEDFRNYLLDYRPYFSEWSEVTLIKPIFHINIDFPQLDSSDLEKGLMTLNRGMNRISAAVIVEDRIYHKIRTNEVYYGTKEDYLSKFNYVTLNGLTDETEHLEKYKILIYEADDNGNLSEDLFYETEWIYAEPIEISNTSDFGINTLIDLDNVEPGQKYGLRVHLFTNNNYEHLSDVKLFEIGYLLEGFGLPDWNSRKEFIDPNTNHSDVVEVNNEDGIAKIRFKWNEPGEYEALPPGILYIKRASSLDNFKNWTLISATLHTEQNLLDDNGVVVNIDDYTIGSLIRYKYSAQYQTIVAPKRKDGDSRPVLGMWSQIYYSAILYPTFYEMLLERQNRQIAIRYNGQVTAWKPVVNRQKIDTLGGRYPKFVENANMNYKQFSINGLISAEGDFNRKFLNEFEGKWVNKKTAEEPDWEFEMTYDGDIQAYNRTFSDEYHYMIRNDTDPDGEYGFNPQQTHDPGYGITNNTEHNDQNYFDTNTNRYKYSGIVDDVRDNPGEYDSGYNKSIFHDEVIEDRTYTRYYQHDLYPKDNWYWERVFREELVKWLNDGEPKLYRSMPEGNVAVILTDLNLTPAQQLGRRLYNFTATLYEIGDGYDLKTLDALGICDIPKLTNSYGETGTSGAIIIDDLNDDEEDDIFTAKERRIGQLYFPEIYGRDIVKGASIANYANAYGDQIIWDRMTILQRLRALYGSGNSTLSNYHILDDGLKLEWVRFRYASKPHYYYANKINNNNNLAIGLNHYWTQINHDGEAPDSGKTPLSIKDREFHVFGKPMTQWGNALLTQATNQWQAINDASLFLGYKLVINDEDIFVNSRGFYQVPSNSIINTIFLEGLTLDPDKDKVVVDYIVSFKQRVDTSDFPLKANRVETIMGQWGDIFPYGTSVGKLINEKYHLIKYQTPDTEGWYDWMVDFPVNHYYTRSKTSIEEKYVFPKYIGYTYNEDGELQKQKGNDWERDEKGNIIIYDPGNWGKQTIERNPETGEIIYDTKEYTKREAQERWGKYFLSKQYEKLPKSYEQSLNYWKGSGVDVSPYAVIGIKYRQHTDYKDFVVGRTGVLSFINDVPTEDIIFYGRRMVQTDISRQPYLDEWEYVLSDQLALELSQLQPDPEYWWNWVQGQSQKTQTLVAFYLGVTVSDLEEATKHATEEQLHYFYNLWLDVYVNNTSEILQPKINTLYPIATNGITHYFIYYIDGHWYEIDESRSNLQEGYIVAKVPVYGYVNYTGEIIRSWYE